MAEKMTVSWSIMNESEFFFEDPDEARDYVHGGIGLGCEDWGTPIYLMAYEFLQGKWYGVIGEFIDAVGAGEHAAEMLEDGECELSDMIESDVENFDSHSVGFLRKAFAPEGSNLPELIVSEYALKDVRGCFNEVLWQGFLPFETNEYDRSPAHPDLGGHMYPLFETVGKERKFHIKVQKYMLDVLKEKAGLR